MRDGGETGQRLAELLELTISFDKRGDLSAILIPRGVIVDKDHN